MTAAASNLNPCEREPLQYRYIYCTHILIKAQPQRACIVFAIGFESFFFFALHSFLELW
jgi:hypothetical protein